jgi:hypothetical protein
MDSPADDARKRSPDVAVRAPLSAVRLSPHRDLRLVLVSNAACADGGVTHEYVAA